jgi:hypothetical protein
LAQFVPGVGLRENIERQALGAVASIGLLRHLEDQSLMRLFSHRPAHATTWPSNPVPPTWFRPKRVRSLVV